MSNFTVYRASAGSGKTFSLVIEYLTLALADDSGKGYRKILGVTFTNKAAAELKERILRFLKSVSVPANSAEYNQAVAARLLANLGIDAPTLAKRAALTYTDILHNYTRLSISTIDKFVHRLIRSFARELQLEGDFEIEMDTKRVFQQVAQLLINEAGKDKELTEWIIKWLLTRLDDGKGAGDYEGELAKFTESLATDEAAAYKPLLLGLDHNTLVEVQQKISTIVSHFDAEVKNRCEAALKIIRDAGLDTEHLAGKSRGGLKPFFEKNAKRKAEPFTINPTVANAFAKGKLTAEKGTIAARVEEITPALSAIYFQIEQLLETDGKNYHFALLMRKQLYLTGFAARIENLLRTYQRDNNLVLISDFNKKIAEVVVNEPAPFIYELLGERYKHFLIDEFQDTSVLQWQNFLPLVDNSLSKGGQTLLVGDGKQSIYRFRGGEVEQFQLLPEIFNAPDNEVFDQYKLSLKRNINIVSIENNYRSSKQVIAFNNLFIDSLTGFLSPELAAIFADGKQQSVREEAGYVFIKSMTDVEDDEGAEEMHFDQLVRDINRVTEKGHRFQDCCVLVYSNNWGSQAAQHLLENGIPIISEESLFVLQSRKTRLLLGCFQLLQNAESDFGQLNVIENAIALGLIKQHEYQAFQHYCARSKRGQNSITTCKVVQLLADIGINTPLAQLRTTNLYSLAELFARDLGFMATYDPFVQFFLDETLVRMQKEGNHLASFINWWQDQGQKAKVVLPEGLDAVRIMTIHKSKGLEFENVFLPMACWGNRPTKNVLWVKPSDEFLPLKAALVPNTKTRLTGTGFEPLNEIETQKDRLDDANKMYVALTRAASNLFVYTDKPNRNGTNAVCTHFNQWIISLPNFNKDDATIEFGELKSPAIKHTEELSNKLILDELISTYNENKLVLGFQAPRLWDDANLLTPKEFGNTIHYLLSKINGTDDLATQLDLALLNGEITADIYSNIKPKLEDLVKTGERNGWLGSQLTARNEMELLFHNGTENELLRPDRVIFGEQETLIIDYKTGSQKPEHIQQVQKYKQALSSLGYPNAKGTLVYVESGVCVDVAN